MSIVLTCLPASLVEPELLRLIAARQSAEPGAATEARPRRSTAGVAPARRA